jgi:NADP-dependent 3-hydroxy acid dehydrogenase YdfG
MTNSLHDRTVLITGASSGIGAATMRLMAAEGARVVGVARRENRLESLVAEIEAAGGSALGLPADVTDRDQVNGCVGRVIEEYGRVDVLVNNAGIMPLSPVRELRVDEWDRMIDVNVRGLLYCIAAVLPVMLRQGSGHIVNVGSVAGRRPFPTGTIYSATKFAVRAISTGLRAELSPHDHIRVTDVQPGVVDTELGDHTADAAARQSFAKRWEGKRKLDAEDIGRAIMYVVSQPTHVNVNEVLVRPTEQET